MAQHFNTVDEYIASFPAEVQGILQEVRRSCRSAVPQSGEMISYGLPTVTLDSKYVV
ncbi:hypothetical protein [Arthrobacter sp. ISL-69]|uniref:hypothetical protein n=1 Tax=Arthrobacter sp. ISL-69 TaxID=2819113 RepID=UPI002034D699|nr:hypothetical protein [Arthrobacter sp. ISL-69]